MNSGFTITMGKGFRIKFDNGYTISVQIGTINYCANRYKYEVFEKPPEILECDDAEVAVFNRSGRFIRGWPHCSEHDDVQGHLTVDQVFEIMQWVKGQ